MEGGREEGNLLRVYNKFSCPPEHATLVHIYSGRGLTQNQ